VLRRPRRIKQPSTGHVLVEMAIGLRRHIGPNLKDTNRRMVANLRGKLTTVRCCGLDVTGWAFSQLSTLPQRVAVGWPAPYRRRKVSR
jgi:hypothetical protein